MYFTGKTLEAVVREIDTYWHCFFDMCQGRKYYERKVVDFEETKICTGSGSADEVAADGLEEYSMKMLIHIVWWSADEELLMNQEGKRKSKFCEGFDDSVVIFNIV